MWCYCSAVDTIELLYDFFCGNCDSQLKFSPGTGQMVVNIVLQRHHLEHCFTVTCIALLQTATTMQCPVNVLRQQNNKVVRFSKVDNKDIDFVAEEKKSQRRWSIVKVEKVSQGFDPRV